MAAPSDTRVICVPGASAFSAARYPMLQDSGYSAFAATRLISPVFVLAAAIAFANCSGSSNQARQASLQAQQAQLRAEQAEAAANRARAAAQQAEIAADRAQKAVEDATREINRVAQHLDRLNRTASPSN